MDWFSKSFPSLAKLIAILGKTTQRRTSPRTRGRGSRRATSTTIASQETVAVGAPDIREAPLLATDVPNHGDSVQVEEASDDLATSTGDDGALTETPGEGAPSIFAGTLGEQRPVAEDLATQPADSGPQPASDVTDTAQSTIMSQMYTTWVELGETISAAQAEMDTLLPNRRKAESLRSEAQELLEQAETAWDEAGHLGDVARKAIERGFTVKLPGFGARLRMIDEIEQARITQAQLRRSANNEAWEEADRARQKATTELLKALTAIAAASSQVERKLRETANLPGVAEALHSSAIEDLVCVRGIGDELAHLRREAFSLLAINDVSVEASRDETPLPVPIPGQLEPQPVDPGLATPESPDRQDAAGGMGPQDIGGTEPAPETEGQQPGVDADGSDSASNNASGVVETLLVGANAADTTPMSTADELRRELEAVSSGPSSEVAPSQISAADELERELAALRPLLASPEPLAKPAVTPADSGVAPAEVAGVDVQVHYPETPSDALLRPGQLNKDIVDQPESVAPASQQESMDPVLES